MASDTSVSNLARSIERFVSASPPSTIIQLARDLRQANSHGFDERFSPSHGTAYDLHLLDSLLIAWRAEATIGSASLALALETAIAARATATSTVELVWTGPLTEAPSTINTTAVLFRIVRHSQKRLTLVSFSAFPIPGLVDALFAACSRGVTVRLILESKLQSGGRLTVDAATPFAALRGLAQFYVWPIDRRPEGASMHAKVAVADGREALVTSANLTERGVDTNLELGTYFEDNDIPAEIERRFDQLVESGTLEAVR